MIEQGKMYIGGSTILLWIGSLLSVIGEFIDKQGDKLFKKGSKITVTNPECQLISPYLLYITFTINGTQKWQISLDGQFKDKYINDKELKELTEEEKFLIISQNRKLWFARIP